MFGFKLLSRRKKMKRVLSEKEKLEDLEDESMEEVVSSIREMIYRDQDEENKEAEVIDLKRPIIKDVGDESKKETKVQELKEKPDVCNQEEELIPKAIEASKKAMEPLMKALIEKSEKRILQEQRESVPKQKTLDQLVQEIAEPIVKEWLNKNLSDSVSRIVEKYVQQLMNRY